MSQYKGVEATPRAKDCLGVSVMFYTRIDCLESSMKANAPLTWLYLRCDLGMQILSLVLVAFNSSPEALFHSM